MAELAGRTKSPFDAALTAGYSGARRDAPGVTVTKRPDLAILSLLARQDATKALTENLLDGYRLPLPDGPYYVAGPVLSAIGTGPGRWLLVGETVDPDDLRRQVTADIEGFAAVADLSDAFAVLRLSGPAARAVLAKGLPIDLHPRYFGPGAAVTSAIALIPLHLWQLDDVPSYDIAVPRSMAASFAVWLLESAVEFGLLVEP